MSGFLINLLQGGSAYNIKKQNGSAAINPATNDETGLKNFQPIAEDILRNDGSGYSIYRYHHSSDHAQKYYDLVVINLVEPAED